MSNVATLLIIDDEPLILDSLSSLLSDKYEVLMAEEGISGLDIFNRRHPSAVILDVNLPFLNGVEVLARIREIDQDVPVIMMTGRGSAQYISADFLWTKKCAELRATGYLTKPVSPEKLLLEVDRAIAENH